MASWLFPIIALYFLSLLPLAVDASDCRIDNSANALQWCSMYGCNWWHTNGATPSPTIEWTDCPDGPSVNDTALLDNGGYSFNLLVTGQDLSVGSIMLGSGKQDEAQVLQMHLVDISFTTHLKSSVIQEGGALILDLGKDNFIGGESVSIARRGSMTWKSGNIALSQGTLEVLEGSTLESTTGAGRSLNNTIRNWGNFTIVNSPVFRLLQSGLISNEHGGFLHLASWFTARGKGSITNHGIMQVSGTTKIRVNVEGEGTIILRTGGTLQTSAVVQCQRLEIHQDSELVIFAQANVSAAEITNHGAILLNGGSISIPSEFEMEGISFVEGHLTLGGSTIRISRLYVPEESTLALTSSPSIFSNESTAVTIDNDGTLEGGFHMLQNGSSLSQNGTLVLQKGDHMDIKGNAVFHPGSLTEVRVYNSKKPAIKVYGTITLGGGNLHITVDQDFAPSPGSSTALLVADEMEGSFDNVLLKRDEALSNPSSCATVTVTSTTTAVLLHCSAHTLTIPATTDGSPSTFVVVAVAIAATSALLVAAIGIGGYCWLKNRSSRNFVELDE